MYEGGKEIEREINIQSIPLFVKAGTILPIGPDVQYSTEKPWDDLEILVYAGADGTYTLYEDEFDNYNYEKGAYSTIDFTYNNKTRQFTVEARKGQFDGMLQERKFRVVLIKNGNRFDAKTINYTGKRVKISL